MQAAIQGGGTRSTTRRRTTSATTGNLGDKAAVDAAFARAAHVTKMELVNNRLVANAMEPRAAIGEYDLATGDYTLYTTSQNPHVIRLLMGAFVLQHSRAQAAGRGARRRRRLRLEDLPLRRGSARHLGGHRRGRPVKWTPSAAESFMSDAHGRDHVTKRGAGAGRGRQVPRAQGRDPRQHGRLPVDLRALRFRPGCMAR